MRYQYQYPYNLHTIERVRVHAGVVAGYPVTWNTGKVQLMQATGYITLTFRAHKEGRQYVAVCEELDVATCATSLEKVFEELADATTLYLTVLEEEGERERVFTERGITIHSSQSSQEPQSVCVRPDEDVVKLHNSPVPSYAFA